MAHQFTRIAASTLGPCVANTVFAAAAEEAGTSGVSGLGSIAPGLVIIAFAIALMFMTTSSKFSRLVAEKIGRRRVSRILNAKSASVLNDFILPGAFGGLTRIDHAILTSGGIICIQTKHYNGMIFGEPDEPQWSNVDGTQRCKFLNPQIQNEGRGKALQKAVPSVPIASLVVFTGSVQFTSSRDENVIHVSHLERYIAEHVFGPSKIKDWDAVWLTVLSTVLTDEDSRKDFQSQVSFG